MVRTTQFSEEVSVKSRVYQIRLRAQDVRRIEQQDKCRLHKGPSRSYYVSAISLKYLRVKQYDLKIIKELVPHEMGMRIIYPLDRLLHRLPPEDVQTEVMAYALAHKKDGKVPTPVYYGRTLKEIPGTFVLDRPGGKRHYRWHWDRRKRKRPPRQLKELFPKLLQRMTDPETRFVISLGGGGLRLFAHPSIFKLIEELGAKDAIEEVWGCSGGAIAGLAYALGADHEIIEQEGYRIYHEKFGLNFQPKRSFSLSRSLFNSFTKAFSGQGVGLKGFVDIQHALEESLKKIAHYKRPEIPFFAIAYNVSSNRNEVLTSEKIVSKNYDGLIKRCSPMDAVLASTAIPILFVPRIIRRGKTQVTYIDGGISEELPLPSVYEKWKHDRRAKRTDKKKLFILTVNLFPQLSGWKVLSSGLLQKLPLVEYLNVITRLADLVRRSRIDEHIRNLRKKDNVEVAQVTLGPLANTAFLDPEIVPLVIEKAKETFFQQLRAIEQKLI